jgi:hypothetical protein
MSVPDFARFLRKLDDDAEYLSRYSHRNVSQLIFHAQNDGFTFSTGDISAVVGTLEAAVIMAKDHEEIDANSSLWRSMWGKPHLDYLVSEVARRFTSEELSELTAALPEES